MKGKLDTRNLFQIFSILNLDLTWKYCQMRLEKMKTSAYSHLRRLSTISKRMASSTNGMLRWSAKSLLASTVSNLIKIPQKQMIVDNLVKSTQALLSMIKTVTSNQILLQIISVKTLMLLNPKMMRSCRSRDRLSHQSTRKSLSELTTLEDQILLRKASDHRLF